MIKIKKICKNNNIISNINNLLKICKTFKYLVSLVLKNKNICNNGYIICIICICRRDTIDRSVIYGSVREPLILQNLKSFFPCFASDVSREMRHSESCPPFEGAAASVIQALVPKQIKSRDVKCAPAPECHSRSARSGTRQFFIFNSSALRLITSHHTKK